MRIGLKPFGKVPEEVLDDLAGALESLGRVERLPPSPVNPEWLDSTRRQFEAERFLDAMRDEAGDRVLGVTDVDLYARGLNFVFGQARTMGRPAIISTARLGRPGSALFRERLEKEAIHELGHTLGLSHCETRECVMWFSNTLEETDRKTRWFCRVCQVTVDFTAKRLRS